MNELKEKVVAYLKAYNDWTITIRQIKDVFYAYPGPIVTIINELIGEGKLIPQPNKSFVKVKIGGTRK